MPIQAVLPAQLINVAAQFASTDLDKPPIDNILVRPAADGSGIRIDSTDGQRAFRVTINDDTWHCKKPMLLDARAFRKRLPYARLIQIDGDLAKIVGVKGNAWDMAQAVNWKSSQYGDYEYPDIDHIWPDRYECDPQDFIQFDAGLLRDFLAEVERHSVNGSVRMSTNKSHNPLHFVSEIPGANHATAEMEFLLMPIYSLARQRSARS